MPRKSLRPHLNQIRAWVRQGRTDAWVAHQLEVTVREIEQFKRQNELVSDEDTVEGASAGDYPEEIDLRAEDDALIAAELEAAEAEAERARAQAIADGEDEDGDDGEDGEDGEPREPSTTARRATACGSTPPYRTTRSMPSTGPDTVRSRSRSRRTGSSSAAPAATTTSPAARRSRGGRPRSRRPRADTSRRQRR
jgi:hypothetical protein